MRTGKYTDGGGLLFSDDRDVYATEFGVWVADGNLVEFVPCPPVECVELTARELDDAVTAEIVRRRMASVVGGIEPGDDTADEITERDGLIHWQRSEIVRLKKEITVLEGRLERKRSKLASTKPGRRGAMSDRHKQILAERKAERDRVRAELRETGWKPPE